jgi:hypothetical protein
MQDLPQGADREWIKSAKDSIENLRQEVSDEKECLEGLLDEIERGAADRFQEKFNRNREEN